jgi:hypothetical protein
MRPERWQPRSNSRCVPGLRCGFALGLPLTAGRDLKFQERHPLQRRRVSFAFVGRAKDTLRYGLHMGGTDRVWQRRDRRVQGIFHDADGLGWKRCVRKVFHLNSIAAESQRQWSPLSLLQFASAVHRERHLPMAAPAHSTKVVPRFSSVFRPTEQSRSGECSTHHASHGGRRSAGFPVEFSSGRCRYRRSHQERGNQHLRAARRRNPAARYSDREEHMRMNHWAHG